MDPVNQLHYLFRYLIEEGAGVDAKDHCGVSPLHWACWNADVDTIEVLLENQSNVFSRDVTGFYDFTFSQNHF